MLTGCQFVNFKSWEDTGQIRLAPLTVFFGRNSSGKSSLLQAGLMMKQTAESLDPKQVLDLGDGGSYVDLGSYRHVVWNHDVRRNIDLSFTWNARPRIPLRLPDEPPFEVRFLSFHTQIGQERGGNEQSLVRLLYVKWITLSALMRLDPLACTVSQKASSSLSREG